MKAVFGIIGVAAFAIATSVGFAQLQAATNPLLDFCPASPAGSAGTCVAAATMLLAAGNPSDDALVAAVNAIAGQVQASHVRGDACDDAAAGIKTLAGGIEDASTKAMAETVASTICGRSGPGTIAAIPTSSLSTPVTSGGCAPRPQASSGASGSSGQASSGASGNTSSGSSGQASGTSGQSSGSSAAC